MQHPRPVAVDGSVVEEAVHLEVRLGVAGKAEGVAVEAAAEEELVQDIPGQGFLRLTRKPSSPLAGFPAYPPNLLGLYSLFGLARFW